jgi:heat shock protein HslJ
LKGEAVTFGRLAGTQMACVNIGEIDREFRDVLKNAKRLTTAADRLQLFDAANMPAAVFASRVQAEPTPGGLAGTSWQLVKFQGSDGKTLTPDDRAKYTIEFAPGRTAECAGGLQSRPWNLEIDAARIRSSSGPLALTRAKCRSGSLHDQIVKQWPNGRSFVMKDGHLFLSLMADGGIFEFEPLTKKPYG